MSGRSGVRQRKADSAGRQAEQRQLEHRPRAYSLSTDKDLWDKNIKHDWDKNIKYNWDMNIEYNWDMNIEYN